MRIKNSYISQGFTLIELLVSTAIVITCSTIIVAIIAATFRDTNTVNSEERIRQGGTIALNQLTDMIKNADSFKGAYLLQNGELAQTSCQSPDSGQSSAVQAIKIVSNGETRTIECYSDGSSEFLTLDGQPLLDANYIIVQGCDLSCTQNTVADPPVITISLDLSTLTTTGLAENTSSITQLSQTVRMTNLNQ